MSGWVFIIFFEVRFFEAIAQVIYKYPSLNPAVISQKVLDINKNDKA
jgi:hypothetical protein